MRRLIKLARLPRGERRLLLRSWLLLVRVRIGLWTTPYARLERNLESRHRRPAGSAARVIAPERIAWAVTLASRYVPGAGTCLNRALAAKCLLIRQGSPAELKLGVTRGSRDSIEAHAWVESAGRVVIGGEERERFTPLHAPVERS